MKEKIEELIKKLKEAKELLNKDELDDKIKSKMLSEMSRRNMTGSKIADHYRDIDETIPAKQRSNIKNSLKTQEVKASKPKLQVVKKSALEMADDLIKSLEGMSKTIPPTPSTAPLRTPMSTPKSGWSQDPSSGAFHNKLHGVISTVKQPSGDYGVVHNGKHLGDFPSVEHAGAKIKEHMNWLGSLKQGKAAYPSASGKIIKSEEEPVKKSLPQFSENELAQKLSSVIPFNNKVNLQPTNEQFEQELIRQGIAVTPDQLEDMNKNWQGTMNNFFAEASKPLTQRFASEEEEAAYWASIKITDKGNDGPGY